MPYRTTEWADANPSLVAVLNDPALYRHHADLVHYKNLFSHYSYLTESQTNDLQRAIALFEARDENDVAGEFDGWQVPNGTYSITLDADITYRYNVHLVREGTLAGQRVVKRYEDGRYKAFAFLTRKGDLKLWRRFEGDAHEDYVLVAKLLLEGVTFLGRDALFESSSACYRAPNATYLIEFSARCSRCNRADLLECDFGYCHGCRYQSPANRILAPPPLVDPNVETAYDRRMRVVRERRVRVALARAERLTQRLMSEVDPNQIR